MPRGGLPTLGKQRHGATAKASSSREGLDGDVFLNERCESLDCYIRAVSYLAMVQPQTTGPVLIRFLDEKAIQPDAQKETVQKEKGGGGEGGERPCSGHACTPAKTCKT
jgi:hypothetical protein